MSARSDPAHIRQKGVSTSGNMGGSQVPLWADQLVVVRSHSGAHDGEDSANEKKQSTKDEQSP